MTHGQRAAHGAHAQLFRAPFEAQGGLEICWPTFSAYDASQQLDVIELSFRRPIFACVARVAGAD